MTSFRRRLPSVFTALLFAGTAFATISAMNPEVEPMPTRKKPIQEMSAGEQEAIAFTFLVAANYSDQIKAAQTRPLFSETRRLPTNASSPIAEIPLEQETVVQEDKPSAPPEAPNFIFSGFVRSGTEITALIRLIDSAEERWVRRGDSLQSWNVTKITEGTIELGFEEHRVVVAAER